MISGEGRRVLVVEDEGIVAMNIQAKLEALGFEVLKVVSSGEAAVEAAATQRPEIVLMDIKLSGDMDGIESAEIIRRDQDIPIIFLTAFSNSAVVERAKAAGPYGYIIKPFQDREVQVAIEMAFYRHRAERLLAKKQAALEAVYSISTTVYDTLEALCEGAASELRRRLGVRAVLVVRLEQDGALAVLACSSGEGAALPERYMPGQAERDRIVRLKEALPLKGDLAALYPDNPVYAALRPGATLLVPVAEGGGRVLGLLQVLFEEGQEGLQREDLHLLEIFARYVAREMERNIMSRRLERAQVMEVIGKLAGGVAHEVRNPLNSIMALTDALAVDLESQEGYAEFLRHMRAQVQRLATLMRDLLDLGKPVEHQHMAPEAVEALCSSALDLWRMSASGSTHKITLRVEEKVGKRRVLSDSKRLQQVLFNLIENATQHSPEGSEVLLWASEAPAGYISLRVVDSGTGLEPAHLREVFEPFYTTRRGGTGLGLSIVKQFVESHGGYVMAYNNTPAPGATVEVRLPAQEGGATGAA